jgi:hypothetical protein
MTDLGIYLAAEAAIDLVTTRRLDARSVISRIHPLHDAVAAARTVGGTIAAV